MCKLRLGMRERANPAVPPQVNLKFNKSKHCSTIAHSQSYKMKLSDKYSKSTHIGGIKVSIRTIFRKKESNIVPSIFLSRFP